MQDPMILPSCASFESPVPELLTSNEEPNDHQVAAILQVIQLASDEMARRRKAGNEDRYRQVELASFIYRHKSVLSPIRRIPAEIIHEIFAYVVDGSGPSLAKFPSQLSVCRLWHRVVKSFPELLAVLPPLRLTRKTKRAEFIALLEARIAQVPPSALLSVLIADCISQGMIPQAPHPAAQTLYKYSERWRSITMTVDTNGRQEVTTALWLKMPNLHRLKLLVPSNAGWQTPVGHWSAFSITPSLREVELECLVPNPILLSIPWHQLTTYKERSKKPHGLAYVLQDGSLIRHVDYRTTDPTSTSGVLPATLNELQSLDFRIYGKIPFSWSPIAMITAPHLQNIRIRDHSQVFMSSLIELLSAGQRLTRLSFHTATMDPGDLTKILLLTPALTELECNDIPFTDLCILYVHPGKSTVVPCLEYLIIHSSTLVTDVEKLAKNRSRITNRGRNEPSGRPGMSMTHVSETFSVRLVFPTMGMCNDAAVRLIGSQRDVEMRLSNILTELDILLDECKARINGRGVFGMWQSFSDWNVGRNLDEIISFLETVSLEELPEFYIWMLSVLHKFWVLDSEFVPEDRSYFLLKRVSELIYSSKLLFRHLDIGQRFLRHGRFCLLYHSPAGDTGHQDLEWNLLHGRYKVVDDTEVFWPHRDFSDNESIDDLLKWRRSVGMN